MVPPQDVPASHVGRRRWRCRPGQSKEGVSVDMFRRHALKLKERSGVVVPPSPPRGPTRCVVPHVKQVWDSIVAESASEGKIAA